MTLGGKLLAPMPPRRDPKTTLSVGRARAKSMVAGLEGGKITLCSSVKTNTPKIQYFVTYFYSSLK